MALSAAGLSVATPHSRLLIEAAFHSGVSASILNANCSSFEFDAFERNFDSEQHTKTLIKRIFNHDFGIRLITLFVWIRILGLEDKGDSFVVTPDNSQPTTYNSKLKTQN